MLAENTVVVVDQKPRRFIECSLSDLLLHPIKTGMVRHIEVNDAACSNFHDQENVESSEENSVLDHEVTREDLTRMILDEDSPGLSSSGNR